MRSRIILILMTLAVLVLPWAGVQLVRQMERLLREGQQSAQLHTAEAIGRAFLQIAGQNLPVGESVILQTLPVPILLDGYADDWVSITQSRPTQFNSKSKANTLKVFAARQAEGVSFLIEVLDNSRRRGEARSAQVLDDYVELKIETLDGLRHWKIANAAPGSVQAFELGEPNLLTPLQGGWQEFSDGYRIEILVPNVIASARLQVWAHDFATDAGQNEKKTAHSETIEGVRIVESDPVWASTLQSLLPERARARLLNHDAWVMAQAGSLLASNKNEIPIEPAHFSSMDDASNEQSAANKNEPNRFYAWLYRLLVSPPLNDAEEYASSRLRIDTVEVNKAIEGISTGAWRPSVSRDTVIAMAAVPLLDARGKRGVLLLEQPSDALLLLTNRAVFGVLAASLLAVLLGATILLSFASIQSMRIRKLRNAAERAMTPDGRLAAQLPHLDAKDEMGDLARSFSRLLAEVSAYTDYLRTLSSKLSHELHTPLAIVKSSLENLEHETLLAPARTYANRARDGAERLGNILRAMSEASRMERAILSADGEDFDLREVVRGCAESYIALLGTRRLDLDLPEHAVPFHGAPELIAQALDKLIDNARSFTPEQGWIRLALVPLERGVFLSVLNQGPLLPEKMQGRLFDSLVSVRDKGGPAGSIDAPHLGLGLFIVRLIAELHEGRASAHNLASGEGVEIRLELLGMQRSAS